MELPYCKICGEHHRLGFCPEYGPAPPAIKPKPVPVKPKPKPPPPRHPKMFGERPPVDFSLGRALTPDDMKQETMPVTKPRFDRNAYQRELMRKRAALKRAQQRPDASSSPLPQECQEVPTRSADHTEC